MGVVAALALPTSAHAADPAPSAFRVNGVELAKDSEGLRLSMPRQYWQDPAREALADRDFMAWLPIDFHNGVIEAEVKAGLAPGAPAFARGFVGLAFRYDGARFESFYLRPTNGVADDQVRRNHAVQYAAFPDWRFDRLRRESPERYETAADIAPGRWVHMRIVVTGAQARLYLDHRASPVLIVNDLKLGADLRGGVGLWIETATIAHFRNIKVMPQ
ncbi:DUF1080 domain-containing protein [Novosphingobium umbonatum]|nr:DUF1080 domain-containing protein [Novosphingobium umbonatum]